MHDSKSLAAWLKSQPNGTREKLAKHCAVHITTLAGWCSNKPIPERKQALIDSFIESHIKPSSHLTIPFTPEEYAIIEAASYIATYNDVIDFARDTLKTRARELHTKKRTLFQTSTNQDHLDKVAENLSQPDDSKSA